MTALAFQDQMQGNFCFGCGADNPDGLQIKSHWQAEQAICRYQPLPHQAAGPRHVLNGGVIATLIDCHAVCTAMADAYRRESRAIGSAPDLWYATTRLTVRYLRPTPLDATLTVLARVSAVDDRLTQVECSLAAGGKVCVEGSVEAIRVPPSWRHGQ